MDSINVRILIVATFSAALFGCKSDSPLDPLERATTIEAASAVDFGGVVGTTVASAPAVRVRDADGHPVRGAQVSFAVTAGGGTVSPALAATDGDGLAITTWRLGTVASTQTLTATVGALAPVVFTVKSVAASPAAIERTGGNNQLAPVGSVIGSPLKAQVLDLYRNPVAGVSVSFIVVSGGGSITPDKSVTDSTGTASASWKLGPVEGVQTAKAQLGDFSVVFSADTFKCPSDTPVCDGLGELLFVRTLDQQIYRINIDGTALTKLTNDGINDSPVASPDGKRIAFVRRTPGGNSSTSDVYVMNADGTNVVRRTIGGQYYSVTWSPDGANLAFDGATGGDSTNIFTLAADGGGSPTVLIPNGYSPSWSPDGKKIVYAHGTGYYDAPQIYVRNVDGTESHRATPDSVGYNGTPAWSPDGQKISFTRCINTCAIYVMNADATGITQVAQGGPHSAWSPDGRWIAFTLYGGGAQSIYFVPVTGATPRVIVSNAWSPSWGAGFR